MVRVVGLLQLPTRKAVRLMRKALLCVDRFARLRDFGNGIGTEIQVECETMVSTVISPTLHAAQHQLYTCFHLELCPAQRRSMSKVWKLQTVANPTQVDWSLVSHVMYDEGNTVAVLCVMSWGQNFTE